MDYDSDTKEKLRTSDSDIEYVAKLNKGFMRTEIHKDMILKVQNRGMVHKMKRHQIAKMAAICYRIVSYIYFSR
jgi:hypothetical protein